MTASAPVVGFLHPGLMGASVAAAAQGRRLWASADRSEATALRAASAGLVDVGSISAMVEAADVIVSICPPAAAEDVAYQVASAGFSGIYVDANAISPDTSRRIGHSFLRYVDGGIVGGPVERRGETWLYLSGPEASSAAVVWTGSMLRTEILGHEIGRASALKMAYAAWTKGSAALLLAVRALAEAEGVDDELLVQWEHSIPALIGRAESTAARVAPKAWRWIAEMEQIAATFETAGLPAGFHEAAGALYGALADFKDWEAPAFPQVIDALLRR